MYEKFLIFVAWIIIVIGVGLWAGRVKKITTREEWSVAGRSFRWITNYFTAHGTQLSALTFFGFPGLLYTVGVPVFYAHYIFYAFRNLYFLRAFRSKNLAKKVRTRYTY
jgi:Na+/proline symporter